MTATALTVIYRWLTLSHITDITKFLFWLTLEYFDAVKFDLLQQFQKISFFSAPV